MRLIFNLSKSYWGHLLWLQKDNTTVCNTTIYILYYIYIEKLGVVNSTNWATNLQSSFPLVFPPSLPPPLPPSTQGPSLAWSSILQCWSIRRPEKHAPWRTGRQENKGGVYVHLLLLFWGIQTVFFCIAGHQYDHVLYIWVGSHLSMLRYFALICCVILTQPAELPR